MELLLFSSSYLANIKTHFIQLLIEALKVVLGKILMTDIHALIAAAGRGTRSGLPYPKTLYPVNGTPILIRILDQLMLFDQSPTIIASPSGEAPIKQCLEKNNRKAYIVIQEEPLGMGNAVLQFEKSPIANAAKNILLVWGDIPFLEKKTLSTLIQTHFSKGNSFTFVSRFVDSAYTIVSRDSKGKVVDVLETREQNSKPQQGERDIGLFIFNKSDIFNLLTQNLPGKFGKFTSEHGFLYLIRHLVARNYPVDALPIATKRELISLNKLSDLML